MSKTLSAMLSQLARNYGDRVFSNPNMPVATTQEVSTSNANALPTKQETQDC